MIIHFSLLHSFEFSHHITFTYHDIDSGSRIAQSKSPHVKFKWNESYVNFTWCISREFQVKSFSNEMHVKFNIFVNFTLKFSLKFRFHCSTVVKLFTWIKAILPVSAIHMVQVHEALTHLEFYLSFFVFKIKWYKPARIILWMNILIERIYKNIFQSKSMR